MHKTVIKKHKTFKQLCQSLSTNSELLPASAYNSSIRCSLLTSMLSRSSAIFFRLTASDGLFLGVIPLRVVWRVGVERVICVYINKDNSCLCFNVDERRQEFQPVNSYRMRLQVPGSILVMPFVERYNCALMGTESTNLLYNENKFPI